MARRVQAGIAQGAAAVDGAGGAPGVGALRPVAHAGAPDAGAAGVAADARVEAAQAVAAAEGALRGAAHRVEHLLVLGPAE